MDINLFSKCLKEAVLESDCVCIPGLGTFVAQLEGASFSDRGAVINPPYRKLSFRAEEQGDTDAFSNRLAQVIPAGSDAAAELQALVEKIRDDLFGKRSIRLEGLGTLRANSRQVIFFAEDEGLDICPDAFGLKPVAVKLRQISDREEIIPVESSVTEEAVETACSDRSVALPEESCAEGLAPVDAAMAEERPRSGKRHIFGKIVLSLLAFCIIAAAVVYFFKDTPWMSDLLDRLLYSEEELQLIRMFQ